MNQFDIKHTQAVFSMQEVASKCIRGAVIEVSLAISENPEADPGEAGERLAGELVKFLGKAGAKYHDRAPKAFRDAIAIKGLNTTHKDIAAMAFVDVGMGTFAVCEDPTEAREVTKRIDKRHGDGYAKRHNFGSYILVC